MTAKIHAVMLGFFIATTPIFVFRHRWEWVGLGVFQILVHSWWAFIYRSPVKRQS